MNELLNQLDPKARKGSKPRCHWLTHGKPDVVARRLTSLSEPWATVNASDRWMPDGFDHTDEAQLHDAPRLLPPDVGRQLAEWWLPADRLRATTPNLDIASTCTIEGRAGYMLVEAKAHDEELINESVGRKLPETASEGRKASHQTIGAAIEAARAGLSEATGLSWNINRDSHYQMSNRFAWAWKLTELGYPVVLVYLGFLQASEMKGKGNPFPDHAAWESLVLEHSVPLFPPQVWNRRWMVNDVPLIPLIRSMEVSYSEAIPV